MKFNDRLAIRILIALAAASLLVWLFLDQSPVKSRIHGINSALTKGTIGHLPAAEEARLHQSLDWLFASAGFQGKITLDQPYSQANHDRGDLQVFVTTPAAQGVTFCGPGNAIYDSELDAIFIDKEIVIPTDWQKLLATPDGGWGLDIPLGLNDAPWLGTYLRFVILHELGHRRLHRHLAATFDQRAVGVSAALRQRENEADEFAIEKMTDAYRMASKFGVNPILQYTGDTINYSVKATMPLPDQVQASLVEMAQAIASGRLALPSATPLFRADIAHPSYLDRAQGLVRESLRHPELDPDLKLFTQYVNESFDRMQEARQSGVVELTAEDPITGTWFDERGLLIVSKGTLHRVSFDKLSDMVRHDKPESLDSATQVSGPLPHRSSGRSADKLTGFWSTPKVGTIFLWSDGEGSVVSTDLRRTETKRIVPVQSNLIFDTVLASPQPSPHAVAIAHGSSGEKWVVAFDGDQQHAAISKDDLDRYCQGQTMPDGAQVDLEFAQIVSESLLMPIISPEKGSVVIRGYLEIHLDDLSPMGVHALQLPEGMRKRTSSHYNPLLTPESGDRDLMFVPDNGRIVPILVNVVRYPASNQFLSGRGVKWQTWEVHEDRDPTLMSEQVFLADYFNRHLSPDQVDNLAITPRLTDGGVRLVPPNRLLINVDSDSVYIADRNSNKVVFHPGSTTIKASVSADGVVALSVIGGYRVFVLRSPVTSRGLP